MMGWAVYVGDVRVDWFKNELIAEDFVDDLRKVNPESDVFYKWEAR